jgi:hypothetical protein
MVLAKLVEEALVASLAIRGGIVSGAH